METTNKIERMTFSLKAPKVLIILLFAFIGTVSLKAQVINPFFLKYPSWCHELEEKAQVYPHAQVVLGCYYLNGDGVEEDYKKAVYWLTKSLTEDNEDIARAYNELGYCYQHGLGVSIDKKQAFTYYHKAADKRHINAYVSLAECYELGEGVQVDIDSALFWYNKGIEYGTGPAKRKSYVESGYILAFIKNDVEKGIEYLEYAIKGGSGTALFLMGQIYDTGIRSTGKDFEKAVYYYKESIKTEKISIALIELANHYYEGTGVHKDIDKAIELYEDAARMGDDTAKEILKNLLSIVH